MNETKKTGRAGGTALRILSVTAVPATIALSLNLVFCQPAPAFAEEPVAPDTLEAKAALFGVATTEQGWESADPDGDKLATRSELEQGTDPLAADTDRDGFLDGVDQTPLSRVFIEWGAPSFTTGDDYRYPAPPWFVGAFQKSGKWKADEDKNGWQGGFEREVPLLGRLALVVNPALLGANLIVEVDLEDEAGGELFAGLIAGDGTLVADDLAGNLVGGLGGEKTVKFMAPFTIYPSAVAVVLYRKGGKVTVYSARAYVDDDGDGLDREQEEQLGTSDKKADSDGDGLDDYEEVFKYGTNPLNPDSDADGMPDGWEVAHKLKPSVNDGALDADSDGRPNLQEFTLKSDPNAALKPAADDEGGLVVGTPLEAEPVEA